MTEPVLEGYLFLGWSSVSGGAVQYTKGQTITVTAPVTTLYAVWVQDTEDPGASDKTNAPGIAKNADKSSAAAGETGHCTLTSIVPDVLGSYLPLTQPDDPTTFKRSAVPGVGHCSRQLSDNITDRHTIRRSYLKPPLQYYCNG